MINSQPQVFNALASFIHTRDSNIYVCPIELTDTPPHFPAVSIVQLNNKIQEAHSTFDNIENVAYEEFKVFVYCKGNDKEEDAPNLLGFISDKFIGMNFNRKSFKPIPNADTSVYRMEAIFSRNTTD